MRSNSGGFGFTIPLFCETPSENEFTRSPPGSKEANFRFDTVNPLKSLVVETHQDSLVIGSSDFREAFKLKGNSFFKEKIQAACGTWVGSGAWGGRVGISILTSFIVSNYMAVRFEVPFIDK